MKLLCILIIVNLQLNTILLLATQKKGEIMKKSLIVALVLIQVVMFSAFADSDGPVVGLNQLKAKAEQGIQGAQTQLGWEYLEGGNGLKKDYKMAVELFEKAIAQGGNNNDAKLLLANCYVNGYGGKPNYNKAMELCKQAASQGSVIAQSALATIQNAIAEHQAEVGKKINIPGVSPEVVKNIEAPQSPMMGQLEKETQNIKVKPAGQ